MTSSEVAGVDQELIYKKTSANTVRQLSRPLTGRDADGVKKALHVNPVIHASYRVTSVMESHSSPGSCQVGLPLHPPDASL